MRCGNLAEGKTSRINGSGEQSRDYVYVEDVARANVLALENGVPSGAYNVGTGDETNVNRLYELLLMASGTDLPPEHGPAEPGEQLRRSCARQAGPGLATGGGSRLRPQGDSPLFRRIVNATTICMGMN